MKCPYVLWYSLIISINKSCIHDRNMYYAHFLTLSVLFYRYRSTKALLHGSRCLHVSHFGRKHERTPVIPFVKIGQNLGGFGRLVLLDKVACFGEDLELIFPCICPIINSLSSRSVPARMRSFPPRASRNFRLRPMNQFSQNGFVAVRFVRQIHGFDASDGGISLRRRDGTEAHAEVRLRIVRDRMLRQFRVSCFPFSWSTSKYVLPLDSRRYGWKTRWTGGKISVHAL